MANHRRINGNGWIPSGNGDPFQTFVIGELLTQRRVNEHVLHELRALRKFEHEQLRYSRQTTLLIESLIRRQDRQDRINRLILKEFKRLRRQ